MHTEVFYPRHLYALHKSASTFNWNFMYYMKKIVQSYTLTLSQNNTRHSQNNTKQHKTQQENKKTRFFKYKNIHCQN